MFGNALYAFKVDTRFLSLNILDLGFSHGPQIMSDLLNFSTKWSIVSPSEVKTAMLQVEEIEAFLQRFVA